MHGEAVLEALLKGREQLLLDHPRHFILLLVCRLSMDLRLRYVLCLAPHYELVAILEGHLLGDNPFKVPF